METKEEVLKQCTIKGKLVKLPDVQLERPLYLQVSTTLQKIGGAWNKKEQGFLFPHDPTDLVAQVAGGVKRNLQKEFQSFYTPKGLSDHMIGLAFPSARLKKPPVTFLEPHAGEGALIHAAHRNGCKNLYWYCELDTTKHELLENISDDGRLICNNFLDIKKYKQKNLLFDIIIANPPFAKNQDIDHIRMMYEVCAPGGRIVTVCSNHFRIVSTKKEKEFERWLNNLNSNIDDLPQDTFKESGANVASCLITIDK